MQTTARVSIALSASSRHGEVKSLRVHPQGSRAEYSKCSKQKPRIVPHGKKVEMSVAKSEFKLQRRMCVSGGMLALGLAFFPEQGFALDAPANGPYLEKFYEDCSKVSEVLARAVELDREGSSASDQDIKKFLSLSAIPVLRDYVRNYGDRRGRLVLRAKGYASVPASDAVLDVFDVLKKVGSAPKGNAPLPRLSASDAELVSEKLKRLDDTLLAARVSPPAMRN